MDLVGKNAKSANVKLDMNFQNALYKDDSRDLSGVLED